MIIIEIICAAGKWAWFYELKPLIRFFVWMVTARDCKHCKYYHYEWKKGKGATETCERNGIKCYKTDCYETIIRKNFERKR